MGFAGQQCSHCPGERMALLSGCLQKGLSLSGLLLSACASSRRCGSCAGCGAVKLLRWQQGSAQCPQAAGSPAHAQEMWVHLVSTSYLGTSMCCLSIVTGGCLAILPTQLFAGECTMGWPASEDPSLRSSSYSLPLAWTAEAMSSLPGDQPDPITTRSPLFPFNS